MSGKNFAGTIIIISRWVCVFLRSRGLNRIAPSLASTGPYIPLVIIIVIILAIIIIILAIIAITIIVIIMVIQSILFRWATYTCT